MALPDLSKLKIARSASATAPRRRRRGWLYGLLALLAIAIGWLALRGSRAVGVETATVASAYPYQAFTVLNATGYVVAQRKAAIASKATGRLEWLGVREGSEVRQDEIVARLESRDVSATREQAAAGVRAAQANLEQGMAELRNAESEYLRAQDLVTRNFISASALDAARARFDKARAGAASLRASIGVAEANLRAADVAVQQTEIRAPFDGVVLTKSANVGDVVTPFSNAQDSKGAVLTMADMSTLEVEADVSEASLSKVSVGQPCIVQLDAFPELRFKGQVSRMVPTMDRSKATQLVKVRFADKDPRVLPEMSARVAFLSQEAGPTDLQPVPAVVSTAIVARDGRKLVYAIRDGKAVATPIETGRKIGELVQQSGLAPGTPIVARPDKGLADGAKVEAARK